MNTFARINQCNFVDTPPLVGWCFGTPKNKSKNGTKTQAGNGEVICSE
ncbi:hypothetical protein IJH06_02800 [Candidatus Saccharibacteria bacterium]|nr:hypothetical protein [Candidatus Saccharibacteria bacterium]